MVAINFTLIVQAINFLIACILLDKLLLKPILKMRQQEEKERQVWNQSIEQAQKELDAVQNIQRKTVAHYQICFAQIRPMPLKQDLLLYEPIFALSTISKDEIKSYQDEAAREIIKRVRYVC